MKSPISMLAVTVLLFSNPSFAGKEKGNGGIAYVCRSPETGEVISVQPLDLYRIRRDLKQEVVESDAPVEEQIQVALERLADFPELLEFFDRTHQAIFENAKTGPISSRLFDTKDAGPGKIDDETENCKYEQLAIYTSDRSLLIQQDLEAKLTNTGRAVFRAHEVFYDLAKTYKGAKDSYLVQNLIMQIFAPSHNRSAVRSAVIAQFQSLPAMKDHATETDRHGVIYLDLSRSSEELRIRMANPNTPCRRHCRKGEGKGDIPYRLKLSMNGDTFDLVSGSIPSRWDFFLPKRSKKYIVPFNAQALRGTYLTLETFGADLEILADEASLFKARVLDRPIFVRILK